MRKKSLFNILLYRHLFLPILLLISVAGHSQTEIDVLGTCLPANPQSGSTASTKFFAQYGSLPDSVSWNFGTVNPNTGDSLTSQQLHPIITYSEAGTFPVRLVIWNNNDADTVTQTVTITQTEDQLQIMDLNPDPNDPNAEPEQVQSEVVLCPGDVRELEARLQSGGGGGGGGNEASPVEVTWYKPQSTLSTTPEQAERITVTAQDADGDGKYDDVGTYYAIYQDPATGCDIYHSFRVVVFNEDDQNNSIWYFGDGAGIDFRTGEAISNSGMAGGNSAPQGNAIIGDANADILFLTNGESLWYGNDVVPATEGTAIGGSREVAQNSLFLGFPTDETLYYLFTINEQRQFSFSTLDLKVGPPPGVATSQEQTSPNLLKGILLDQPVAEKLTAASRDSAGSWVVVHELGNNHFLSFPVSQDGIGQPVRSEVGSVYGTSDEAATGYMRFSEDGDILAATVNNGGSSQIELFRFDADSGLLSDPVILPIEESGTLYGIIFSENRLYATVKNSGGPSYLYQYTLDSALDVAYIESSKVTLEIAGEELGALQIGPDGQLYIARNGLQELYRIGSPSDSLTSNFSFDNNTFDLAAGTRSTLGLPNFGENRGVSPPEAEVFVATPTCFGDSIEVTGTQRYQSDQSITFYLLDANKNEIRSYTEPTDGQGASITIPPADYGNPGTYFIRMTILNPCGIYPNAALGQEEVIQEFTINPKPEAEIDDTNNLILCEEQSVTLNGYALVNGTRSDDASKYNFTWYDAVSNAPVQDNDHISTPGNKLITDTAGVWYVVVEDMLTGCTGQSTPVEVLDNRPQAELGDDINVCVGEILSGSLDASFQNASDFSFAWFLNGQSLNNGGQTQPLNIVDTEFPGSYQFVVEITPATASAGECFKRDTVNVLISAEPLVRIVASENNCDGTAVLTARVDGGSGDYTYQWSGPGITSGQGTRQIRISGSGAQEYTVNVLDGTSGCSTTTAPYTIDLENPLADLRLEVDRECGEAVYTLSLETSYSGDSTDLIIRWFRGANPGEEITSYRNYRSIPAEEGIYRAEVILQTANCADTATQVRELAPIANESLTLQSTYVLCPNIPDMSTDTLVVEGFQLYRWKNLTTGQTTVNETGKFVLRTEGNYELQVNDCEPVPFRVIYDCTPTLWLPNAIRIGGKNNSFRILNQNMLAGVSDFQIVILNRWGQPIWQSHDPSFEWRGTTQNGEPVMVSTYVYVITYRNQYGEDQRIQRQRGGVTVLK